MKLAPTYMSINAKEVGHSFLWAENTLKTFHAKRLVRVGSGFMERDESLQEFRAYHLAISGLLLLNWNTELTELHAPKLSTNGTTMQCHPNRDKLLRKPKQCRT